MSYQYQQSRPSAEAHVESNHQPQELQQQQQFQNPQYYTAPTSIALDPNLPSYILMPDGTLQQFVPYIMSPSSSEQQQQQEQHELQQQQHASLLPDLHPVIHRSTNAHDDNSGSAQGYYTLIPYQMTSHQDQQQQQHCPQLFQTAYATAYYATAAYATSDGGGVGITAATVGHQQQQQQLEYDPMQLPGAVSFVIVPAGPVAIAAPHLLSDTARNQFTFPEPSGEPLMYPGRRQPSHDRSEGGNSSRVSKSSDRTCMAAGGGRSDDPFIFVDAGAPASGSAKHSNKKKKQEGSRRSSGELETDVSVPHSGAILADSLLSNSNNDNNNKGALKVPGHSRDERRRSDVTDSTESSSGGTSAVTAAAGPDSSSVTAPYAQRRSDSSDLAATEDDGDEDQRQNKGNPGAASPRGGGLFVAAAAGTAASAAVQRPPHAPPSAAGAAAAAGPDMRSLADPIFVSGSSAGTRVSSRDASQEGSMLPNLRHDNISSFGSSEHVLGRSLVDSSSSLTALLHHAIGLHHVLKSGSGVFQQQQQQQQSFASGARGGGAPFRGGVLSSTSLGSDRETQQRHHDALSDSRPRQDQQHRQHQQSSHHQQQQRQQHASHVSQFALLRELASRLQTTVAAARALLLPEELSFADSSRSGASNMMPHQGDSGASLHGTSGSNNSVTECVQESGQAVLGGAALDTAVAGTNKPCQEQAMTMTTVGASAKDKSNHENSNENSNNNNNDTNGLTDETAHKVETGHLPWREEEEKEDVKADERGDADDDALLAAQLTAIRECYPFTEYLPDIIVRIFKCLFVDLTSRTDTPLARVVKLLLFMITLGAAMTVPLYGVWIYEVWASGVWDATPSLLFGGWFAIAAGSGLFVYARWRKHNGDDQVTSAMWFRYLVVVSQLVMLGCAAAANPRLMASTFCVAWAPAFLFIVEPDDSFPDARRSRSSRKQRAIEAAAAPTAAAVSAALTSAGRVFVWFSVSAVYVYSWFAMCNAPPSVAVLANGNYANYLILNGTPHNNNNKSRRVYRNASNDWPLLARPFYMSHEAELLMYSIASVVLLLSAVLVMHGYALEVAQLTKVAESFGELFKTVAVCVRAGSFPDLHAYLQRRREQEEKGVRREAGLQQLHNSPALLEAREQLVWTHAIFEEIVETVMEALRFVPLQLVAALAQHQRRYLSSLSKKKSKKRLRSSAVVSAAAAAGEQNGLSMSALFARGHDEERRRRDDEAAILRTVFGDDYANLAHRNLSIVESLHRQQQLHDQPLHSITLFGEQYSVEAVEWNSDVSGGAESSAARHLSSPATATIAGTPSLRNEEIMSGASIAARQKQHQNQHESTDDDEHRIDIGEEQQYEEDADTKNAAPVASSLCCLTGLRPFSVHTVTVLHVEICNFNAMLDFFVALSALQRSQAEEHQQPQSTPSLSSGATSHVGAGGPSSAAAMFLSFVNELHCQFVRVVERLGGCIVPDQCDGQQLVAVWGIPCPVGSTSAAGATTSAVQIMETCASLAALSISAIAHRELAPIASLLSLHKRHQPRGTHDSYSSAHPIQPSAVDNSINHNNSASTCSAPPIRAGICRGNAILGFVGCSKKAGAAASRATASTGTTFGPSGAEHHYHHHHHHHGHNHAIDIASSASPAGTAAAAAAAAAGTACPSIDHCAACCSSGSVRITAMGFAVNGAKLLADLNRKYRGSHVMMCEESMYRTCEGLLTFFDSVPLLKSFGPVSIAVRDLGPLPPTGSAMFQSIGRVFQLVGISSPEMLLIAESRYRRRRQQEQQHRNQQQQHRHHHHADQTGDEENGRYEFQKIDLLHAYSNNINNNSRTRSGSSELTITGGFKHHLQHLKRIKKKNKGRSSRMVDSLRSLPLSHPPQRSTSLNSPNVLPHVNPTTHNSSHGGSTASISAAQLDVTILEPPNFCRFGPGNGFLPQLLNVATAPAAAAAAASCIPHAETSGPGVVSSIAATTATSGSFIKTTSGSGDFNPVSGDYYVSVDSQPAAAATVDTDAGGVDERSLLPGGQSSLSLSAASNESPSPTGSSLDNNDSDMNEWSHKMASTRSPVTANVARLNAAAAAGATSPPSSHHQQQRPPRGQRRRPPPNDSSPPNQRSATTAGHDDDDESPHLRSLVRSEPSSFSGGDGTSGSLHNPQMSNKDDKNSISIGSADSKAQLSTCGSGAGDDAVAAVACGSTAAAAATTTTGGAPSAATHSSTNKSVSVLTGILCWELASSLWSTLDLLCRGHPGDALLDVNSLEILESVNKARMLFESMSCTGAVQALEAVISPLDPRWQHALEIQGIDMAALLDLRSKYLAQQQLFLHLQQFCPHEMQQRYGEGLMYVVPFEEDELP